MLKKSTTIIAIILFAMSFTYTSCKKDQEEVIECLAEGFLVHISHTEDAQDGKIINFEITYSGEHDLDNSISWDFGDGHTGTHGATTQHTYSADGTFLVKAEVTIRNSDAYCTYEKEETVNID